MMIRINLIPTKRKKKAKPVPSFVVWAVLILVLSAAGTAYTAYFMKSRISALNAQKAANDKKLADLKERIKAVSNFEALNKAFTAKKQLIEKLRANQSIPVRLLTEINKYLTEGIWFNSLTMKGDSIEIEGAGFSNSDIVAFIQSLKGSQMLGDAVLQETHMNKQDGVDVYIFKLIIKMKAG